MSSTSGPTGPPPWLTSKVAVLATVLSLLVGGILGYAFAVGQGGSPEAIGIDLVTTTSAKPVEATTTTTAHDSVGPDKETVIEAGPNLVVIVPRGAVDGQGGRIVVEPASQPSDVGSLLAPIGPTVDISIVGAELVGEIEIQFRIPEGAQTSYDDTFDPSLFALHWGESGLEVLDSEYDEASRVLSVKATELSIFSVFTIGWDLIVEVAKSILEPLSVDLIQFADLPSCLAEDDSSWQVSGPDVPLKWCKDQGTEGSRTLQMVNTRRYPVEVSVASSGTFAVDRLADFDIAASVANQLTSGNALVLGAGSGAAITFGGGGAEATIDVRFDAVAQNMTYLVTAIEIIAALAGLAPGGSADDITALATGLDLVACLTSLGIEPDTWIEDTIQFTFRGLSGCFDSDLLRAAFGVIVGTILGATVGAIFAVIEFLSSTINALFDLFRQDTNQTVTVILEENGDPEVGEPPPDAGDYVFSGWPVDDFEGTPAYFAYLGASFLFPSWSSCSASYCIAAADGTVYLYDLRSGIDEAGSIPEDHPDPVGAFLAGGFTIEEVEELFMPGPP